MIALYYKGVIIYSKLWCQFNQTADYIFDCAFLLITQKQALFFLHDSVELLTKPINVFRVNFLLTANFLEPSITQLLYNNFWNFLCAFLSTIADTMCVSVSWLTNVPRYQGVCWNFIATGLTAETLLVLFFNVYKGFNLEAEWSTWIVKH